MMLNCVRLMVAVYWMVLGIAATWVVIMFTWTFSSGHAAQPSQMILLPTIVDAVDVTAASRPAPSERLERSLSESRQSQ